MTKIAVGLVLTLTLASGSALAAGNAAAGQRKAGACAACHGVDGISGNDQYPSLAGQKQSYLVRELKGFRDGTRTDPMMSPLAKPLSDADIEDVATYFASLNPTRAATTY